MNRCPNCGSTSKLIRMMDRIKSLFGVLNDGDIALRLGIKRKESVSVFRRRLGIPGIKTWSPKKRDALRIRRGRPSISRVRFLRAQGLTFKEIGERFNTSRQRIHQILGRR